MKSPENLHTDGLLSSDVVVKTNFLLWRDNLKKNKRDVACCDNTKRTNFVSNYRESNQNHDLISFFQDDKNYHIPK